MYGLLGHPVKHSLSARLFSQEFGDRPRYDLIDIPTFQDLKSFRNEKGKSYLGLNVTHPWKEKVIDLLDEIDPQAKTIGAINCIDIRNEKWVGYNTDAYAFYALLQSLKTNVSMAMVLGSGGAAKAVSYALSRRGVAVSMVTRHPQGERQISYEFAKRITRIMDMVVNCTPVGMEPDVDDKPDLDYSQVWSGQILIDLVYAPAETAFMAEGKSRGCIVYGGLPLLDAQARRSWKIWGLL